MRGRNNHRQKGHKPDGAGIQSNGRMYPYSPVINLTLQRNTVNGRRGRVTSGDPIEAEPYYSTPSTIIA